MKSATLSVPISPTTTVANQLDTLARRMQSIEARHIEIHTTAKVIYAFCDIPKSRCDELKLLVANSEVSIHRCLS